MAELLIPHIEAAAAAAQTWGPLLILLLMAIESSLIPLPSEVVMIPAGFLAARGELPPGDPLAALALAIACGTLGSLLGAGANYAGAYYLGRPVMLRLARWFLVRPESLEHAERWFREYGDIATFTGRLLPGVRHLISIPAGLSRMDLRRFAGFTSLGAALWCAVLVGVGYQLGRGSRDMSYAELVHLGTALVSEYMLWIALGCAALGAAWWHLHRGGWPLSRARAAQD